MIVILLSLSLVLVMPEAALAWGGGTHLQLGTFVLANLQILPATVASIVGAYPNDFLYGCLAADITVGKKFTHYLLNCHRWDIGKKVLHHAATDPQRSCAYGYLAHLAADAIAHNYYVPVRIMGSFSTVTLKHAYWEMQFDSFVEHEIWEIGGKVAREHYEDNDTLLRNVIAETLFSFGTNKRIFNSIMLVSRIEQWQQAIRTVNEVSRSGVDESDREEFLERSRSAVLEVLIDLEETRFMDADPTGERALKAAEAVRKNLSLLYRSGKITKQQADEMLAELKGKLAVAICNPKELLQITSRL
jgi:hypothetical protein